MDGKKFLVLQTVILQNYCIPLALSLHSFCSAAAIPLQ